MAERSVKKLIDSGRQATGGRLLATLKEAIESAGFPTSVAA
jgi:hypothetical protein